MDELVVNVMNTPVEAVESEFPVRIERYELARDSGGPGSIPRRTRRCGGNGASWPTRSIVNLRMDRFKFASPGIFGAKPARASKAVLNPGTAAERPLTSKVAGLRLARGDLLSVEFAGGGGWGDPYQRDVERVQRGCLPRLRLARMRRARTTASCSPTISPSTPTPRRGCAASEVAT